MGSGERSDGEAAEEDERGDWIGRVEKRIYDAREEIRRKAEPHKFGELKRFLGKFFEGHLIWDKGHISHAASEEEIGDAARECFSIADTSQWISHRFNRLPGEVYIIRKSPGLDLYSKRAHVVLSEHKREPYIRLNATVYVTYKEYSDGEGTKDEHKELSISNYDPLDGERTDADPDFRYDLTSEVIALEVAGRFSSEPERIKVYRKLGTGGYNCMHCLVVRTAPDYMIVDKTEEIVSKEHAARP